ncbi:hypothetical protein BDV33DRAFT_11439 [Aspergillus novoparasiticus]|uniref:Uncharacterized protein n=1 Tax=Aspergillus novoparasiticus TaxID=986946 RepID=A0A5N6F5W0_9EURO|nr:hypothetical protein BDV33DRAFT_11439 [Aspergillus novoparasiticus]
MHKSVAVHQGTTTVSSNNLLPTFSLVEWISATTPLPAVGQHVETFFNSLTHHSLYLYPQNLHPPWKRVTNAWIYTRK